MGQEIVYCYQCQTRLLGSEFDKGLAFRVGAQVSCSECVRGLFSSLPPAQIDAEIARLKGAQVTKRGGTSSRVPAVPSSGPDSSAKIRLLPAPPAAPVGLRSKLPLLLGGAAIAGGLILTLALSMSSGRPPAPAADDPPPPTAGPKPPAPLAAPGSELPPGSFVELDRATAARIESDDFSAAARELDKARLRRAEPAWAAGIDERRSRLEAKARDALPGFLEPARAAHHEGRADEVERLRSFIAAFPSLAADFDRRLASIPEPVPIPPRASAPATPKPPPAPKPASSKPPSEASSYRSTWNRAMAARDAATIAAA
ncbi:MAG TPA: hypothetical protein VKW04_12565, partial [Planctomycetota bacterium]|nr:hypothetical protein [Planctomycetota bacterium]